MTSHEYSKLDKFDYLQFERLDDNTGTQLGYDLFIRRSEIIGFSESSAGSCAYNLYTHNKVFTVHAKNESALLEYIGIDVIPMPDSLTALPVK
jgi:hypothetical protein